MKELLLNVHLEPLPEGGFLATSDDLPGLVAQAARPPRRSRSPRTSRANSSSRIPNTAASCPPRVPNCQLQTVNSNMPVLPR